MRRKEIVEHLRSNHAFQPSKGRDEHELKLRDDRPGDTKEEIVVATVLEVVFDPRPAYPTHAAIDDNELAMVDVPEPVEVPLSRCCSRNRPDGTPELSRPDDANVDASGEKALVKLMTRTIGVGALSIDYESNRNIVGRLAKQHLRELISDNAWPKPELVDVYRRCGS
jgi:hypothetical protein